MKEFITWSEGYSVGIKEIDAQHKKLIELINGLYGLYVEKNEKDIGKIIKEIKEYTIYHFSAEEKLFRENKYDGARAHIKLHEDFIQEFNDMVKDYTKMPSVLNIRILTFLQKWLTNHILKEDKKYVGFLQ